MTDAYRAYRARRRYCEKPMPCPEHPRPQSKADGICGAEIHFDAELLANLKAALPELEKLLERASSHWDYEDAVYRFYHQSFKVYRVQETTTAIVEALAKLLPEPLREVRGDQPLNDWFTEIVKQGTGHVFEVEHNGRWLEVTRPIIEAFFHARFFLEMAVKYAKEIDEAPKLLASGWAAVLYLYDMR